VIKSLSFNLKVGKQLYICTRNNETRTGCIIRPAGVVKLVDTPDLGSGAARCVGSSPITRTKPLRNQRLFLCAKFLKSFSLIIEN
jgi:hypothetical protein